MLDLFKQKDKQKHILVSMILVILFTVISDYFNFFSSVGSIIFGLSVSGVAGLAHEFILNKHFKIGVFDLDDLKANSIGLFFGVVLMIVCNQVV